MANQQIYTTIPIANFVSVELRADMKSPSHQVALVALLTGKEEGKMGKRWNEEEEERSATALHPQFSFNWLSPEENGKLDLACKRAIFHCQKRKQVKIVRQKKMQ